MNDYLNLDDILFAAGRYARHNCDEDTCSALDAERNFAKDWRTHAYKAQWDRTHPQKEEFIQKSRWSY